MYKSVFIDDKTIDKTKALKECVKYDCISFDVFDTLIKRNLGKPEDIFVILNTIALEFDVTDFMTLRQKAELKLREKKSFIKLDEIYDEISKSLDKNVSIELKKREIELEKNYCQPNFEVVELLNELRKNGKRIIAISDMYLSSTTILQILNKCKIVVDNIYVSCECNAKKSDGTLFKYVLKKENLCNYNMIHIGDSLKADIFGAKFAGIKSIHVKKNPVKYNDKKFYKKIIDKQNYDVFFRIINNNLKSENSFYRKFGFAVLGPLVYNYVVWLKNMCKQNNLSKIFFFARDGYIFKNVFESLFKGEFTTSYIYFSRRAIRVPYSAMSPSYENIMKYFPKTKILTVKTYFENFGLNPSNYESLIKKYNLKMDDHIYYNDLFKNNAFRKIFDNIYEDIKQEAQKEYEILKKYIKQEKLSGNVAMVDVGWHNSMQFYLEKIAKYNNYNLNLYGFYVGKMHNEKDVNFSKGFISDTNDIGYADSALSFIGLIESVFLALEGSTKTYIENQNGKISPVLFDYEYNEKDLEYGSFLEIQAGIYDFIDIIKSLDYIEIFSLSGKDSYLPLKSFGINPYLYDIKFFSKFRYFSEEIVYFSNSKSLLFYIFNIKKFKLDFYQARWKVGFMKELFKIKLPYYRIYKIYRRMKG